MYETRDENNLKFQFIVSLAVIAIMVFAKILILT